MKVSKKGTQKAIDAGKKAAQTRAKNKVLGLTKSKLGKGVDSKEFKMKFKALKPKIEVVKLEFNLKKLKDTEEYTIYIGGGPVKIIYSPLYKTLRISPHCTQLKVK